MSKLSDLPKLIEELLKSKIILEKAGQIAVERIPKRTRLGNGVRENLGDSHKLPPLKESTVKIRKDLQKQGRLTGPLATPKKSGINRTGKALNSIKAISQPGHLEITLDKSQQAKVDDLIKINPDYSFMKLSKPEFKAVFKAITDQIDRIVKRIRFTDL